MQYLQVISGLLFDDLLFTIDCFSSPLVELADGYEVGEGVGTLLLVGSDSDTLSNEVCLTQFAELLHNGL